MSATVSVVIPTYNGTRLLRQAVASALGQTHPPQEVIVIDDGSTEDVEAVLAPVARRIVFARQPNRGVAAARNHGIRLATGTYVALLDHDDLCAPDRLEKQVRALSEHSSAVACFTGHWTFDATSRLKERSGVESAGDTDAVVHLSRYLVFGPTVMFHRERASHLEFPEDVPCVDDHIFVALLRGVGPFVVLPDCLYGYRQWGGQTSKTKAALCDAGAFDLRLQWALTRGPGHWPGKTREEIEAVMWQGVAYQVAANYWARNRDYFLNDRDYIRRNWPQHMPIPPEANLRWYPDWIWRVRGLWSRIASVTGTIARPGPTRVRV